MAISEKEAWMYTLGYLDARRNFALKLSDARHVDIEQTFNEGLKDTGDYVKILLENEELRKYYAAVSVELAKKEGLDIDK